jgi:hypothetical protein
MAAFAFWAMAAAIGLVSQIQSAHTGLALINAMAVIATCWGLRSSVKSVMDRTEIEILSNDRSFLLRTPADDYLDEKEFDRKLVRDLGRFLQDRGIRVIDQF